MGRSIDAADTYATVYHTGLSLTRKKVGRGKRAVSYSGLRLAEGFEACRAPNRSGLRSACPCRWPPSAARRSPPLLGVSSRGPRQSDIGRTPRDGQQSSLRPSRLTQAHHPAPPALLESPTKLAPAPRQGRDAGRPRGTRPRPPAVPRQPPQPAAASGQRCRRRCVRRVRPRPRPARPLRRGEVLLRDARIRECAAGTATNIRWLALPKLSLI